MKVVIWEDERGYKRRSLLRDNDPDHLAKSGVPLDPPDLTALDWEGLMRDLHNALVERGLSSWQDVLDSQTGITSSIISVFKRPIVGLYKQQATAAKFGGQDG
jgi:hypothetical protein